MTDILEEIIVHKRIEIERFKADLSEQRIHSETEHILGDTMPSLKNALMTSDTGIIAEFKRRSPSKGWIKEKGSPIDIPLSYQNNGASAISILTDRYYFGGDNRFIFEARQSGVTLPVLYKNFIIDEYQLFQARLSGAAAVLLIAAAISKDECRSFMHTAHELGMEVLLELHADYELDYADLEPDVCGVNNRNLGTFVTDVRNSFRLSAQLPNETCKVSESGISDPMTVCKLRMAGFRGFLIGENFMKEDNPGLALSHFIDIIRAYRAMP